MGRDQCHQFGASPRVPWQGCCNVWCRRRHDARAGHDRSSTAPRLLCTACPFCIAAAPLDGCCANLYRWRRQPALQRQRPMPAHVSSARFCVHSSFLTQIHVRQTLCRWPTHRLQLNTEEKICTTDKDGKKLGHDRSSKADARQMQAPGLARQVRSCGSRHNRRQIRQPSGQDGDEIHAAASGHPVEFQGSAI